MSDDAAPPVERCPCCGSNEIINAGWGRECADCHRWWMNVQDEAAFHAAMAEQEGA
jgi:hypothetical protein